MSGGWWEAGGGMREEFGNCLFLVQNHSGRGTLDRGRIERSEMVDCPLSTVELDRRLFYRDERNTIIGEGKRDNERQILLNPFCSLSLYGRGIRIFFLVREKLPKTNNINICIPIRSFVSAWFKGGIFYIHVPVFGAYYLFYSWNNVKRCQRWIGPHVHAKGKFTFSSLFSHEIFFRFLLTVGEKKRSLFYRQIEKLLEPTVWLDAATQVFYSFGLAFGSLIAFGSYNTPDNHCVRDVILVSCCNAFTAIYASIVIFAILGFKAMTNVDKCLAG